MNEKYKIIGFRHASGNNKQGQPFDGYNVYVTYEAKDVSGLCCERLWVPMSVIAPGQVFNVGQEIAVSYNRYGRISAIEVF